MPTIHPMAAVWLAALLVSQCNEPGPFPQLTKPAPYSSDWEPVLDVPFPTGAVQTLTIGGHQTRDNFANRGDVLVRFADVSNIVVEMRRFTVASSEDLASDHLDRLELWAYQSSPSGPRAPAQMDPSADCAAGSWLDDCEVRVYYDGQTQLVRSGADLRVTLPSDWRGLLKVETEDNDRDHHHHVRSDVCIEQLPTSANIETGSGRVFVSLADGAAPMPSCAQEDLTACEESGWPLDCPCFDDVDAEFGELALRGRDGAAVDLTISVPKALWSTLWSENRDLSPTPTDAELEAWCDVDVSIANYAALLDDATAERSLRIGTANHPGQAAPLGGGFRIQAISDTCTHVSEGTVELDEAIPESARGRIRVCNDCVPASCGD